MARPCKSAKLLSECSQTKEETEERIALEEKLKGNSNNLSPPDYLNDNQVELFRYIKNELEESNLLGNLDIYILSKCVIAIDRLQMIESNINKNQKLFMNSQFMSNKKNYDNDFFRCCNELSLSPQSRAKLGNINLNKKQDDEDPIKKVLRGED